MERPRKLQGSSLLDNSHPVTGLDKVVDLRSCLCMKHVQGNRAGSLLQPSLFEQLQAL